MFTIIPLVVCTGFYGEDFEALLKKGFSFIRNRRKDNVKIFRNHTALIAIAVVSKVVMI